MRRHTKMSWPVAIAFGVIFVFVIFWFVILPFFVS